MQTAHLFAEYPFFENYFYMKVMLSVADRLSLLIEHSKSMETFELNFIDFKGTNYFKMIQFRNYLSARHCKFKNSIFLLFILLFLFNL